MLSEVYFQCRGKLPKDGELNLPTEHYFGFGKLDKNAIERRVSKLLNDHTYIFEYSDNVKVISSRTPLRASLILIHKREYPYIMKVIAQPMLDHFSRRMARADPEILT